MIYLVDANVLSEPMKPLPQPRVVDWLREHEGQLVVDSIVLGEIAVGVLGLAPGRKRNQLELWFESLTETIQCLPWDALVSRSWAQLIVRLKKLGRTMPILDSMIAATALAHDLNVATRNVQDFSHAGLKVTDPFA